MGLISVVLVTMQFLILASGLVAACSAQLVAYPNGAVAPFDPANAAATKEHFAALAEAGAVVNPYFTHAQGLAAPLALPLHHALPHVLYGRKKRQVLESDGLVTYPNGARAPYDHNVAIATANHYAAKVHPPAAAVYGPLIYGRKKRSAGGYGGKRSAGGYGGKRSADPQFLTAPVFPYAAGYPLLPYAIPFAPFVAHPNGALVPLEPKDVIDARAEHLAAVAEAGRKKRSAGGYGGKRSAVPQFLTAPVYPYAAGYPLLPYAVPFAPFVAHPNG